MYIHPKIIWLGPELQCMPLKSPTFSGGLRTLLTQRGPILYEFFGFLVHTRLTKNSGNGNLNQLFS